VSASDDEQPSTANDSGRDRPFEPVPTRRALGDLWRNLITPKSVAGNRPLSSRETKRIVNGLDKRERTIGFVLSILNLYVIAVRAHQLHTSSTAALRSDTTQFLGLGLALSAVVIAAIIIKRRALLGFAAVFIGLVFLEYGAPSEFLISCAFGIWLILRAQKAQKLQRAGAQNSPVAREPRSSKRTKNVPQAPHAPKASKRYTPPRRSKASGRR
jgi:hypothetical protein